MTWSTNRTSVTVLQNDACAEALLGSVVRQWIYLLVTWYEQTTRICWTPHAADSKQTTTVLNEWREGNVYFISVQFCWWSCLSYTVYLPEDSCMLQTTVWHVHIKSHSCIEQNGILYVRCKSPEFKTTPTKHCCHTKTVNFNVCIHNLIDVLWTDKFQRNKVTRARKYKTCNTIGLLIMPQSSEDEFLAPTNNHL